MPIPNTLPILIEKLELTDSGCWEWKGYLDRYGYGQIGWLGKVCRAHRVFYRELVGEIPDGLVIDHLCRNRKCCNPFHMEPVTNKENILRGELVIRNRKTHCPKGHEYTESNKMISNDYRRCVTCHKESSRKWNRKQKK